MKYLKKYELFEKVEIIDDKEGPIIKVNGNIIHSSYGYLRNFKLKKDGSIDVNDSVNLNGDHTNSAGLTKIPLKFNYVTGFFWIDNNNLTSLEGSPQVVGQSPEEEDGNYFSCDNNKLTSLKGGPIKVFGNFYCSYNKLTSLEGAPQSIGGDFHCTYNQLTSLDHLPNVSGEIYIWGNPVYSIIRGWIEQPEKRWEKWEYFQDLSIIQEDKVILPRLEEFHEVMEIPMPNLNEIKKYYKIIE